MDLVVEQAVADPKLRYRAARALVALGPDMPALAAAQTALGTARGRLLAAAKPGRAAEAAAVLDPIGVHTVQAPAFPGPASAAPVAPAAVRTVTLRVPVVPRTSTWVPWAGGAAAVLVAGGLAAWLLSRPAPEQPVQTVAAGTASPAAAPGPVPISGDAAPSRATRAPSDRTPRAARR